MYLHLGINITVLSNLCTLHPPIWFLTQCIGALLSLVLINLCILYSPCRCLTQCINITVLNNLCILYPPVWFLTQCIGALLSLVFSSLHGDTEIGFGVKHQYHLIYINPIITCAEYGSRQRGGGKLAIKLKKCVRCAPEIVLILSFLTLRLMKGYESLLAIGRPVSWSCDHPQPIRGQYSWRI